MGVDPPVGAGLLSLLLTGLVVRGRHDRLIRRPGPGLLESP